jgi:hypothetical protein
MGGLLRSDLRGFDLWVRSAGHSIAVQVAW